MPRPGRRSPGATRAPRGACVLMPRRGRRCALRCARVPTVPRTGPAPWSLGPPRAASAPPPEHPAFATCVLRPREPKALPAPQFPGCPLHPRETAHLLPRRCTPEPRSRPCCLGRPGAVRSRSPVPAAAAAVAAAPGPAPSSLAYPAGGPALQNRGGGGGGSLP